MKYFTWLFLLHLLFHNCVHYNSVWNHTNISTTWNWEVMSLYQTQGCVRELKTFFTASKLLCMYQMDNNHVWVGANKRTRFERRSTYCNLLLCCCIDRLAIAVTVSVSSFSFCRASIAEQTAVCAVRLMHGQCGSFKQSNHRYSKHMHAHYRFINYLCARLPFLSTLYFQVWHEVS